ncbi:MAG: hypothetical protein GXP55_15375 [Deltaproteobacteria bacterium]|nr:hypothetical protein [Deltaproteobacteria bacterium]
MKMTYRLSLSLMVAVLALGAGGCFVDSTVATTIHNPLETGQIDQNVIPHQYPRQERNYALPAGSLNDQATLTRLDAEAVCFQVDLRAITTENGQTWSDLQNWNPTLALSPGETVLQGPTIQLSPSSAQQYAGRVPIRTQTGSEQVCTRRTGPRNNRRCDRWETRPIYQTRWVPGTVTVVTGGGSICFPNGGQITLATQAIDLRLRRTARSMNFEWDFQSIVAQ